MSIGAVTVGRRERRTPLLVNMYSQFEETLTQHQGTALEMAPNEERDETLHKLIHIGKGG